MKKSVKTAVALIEDILNAQYHNCHNEEQKKGYLKAYLNVSKNKEVARKYINECYEIFRNAKKDIGEDK